MKPGDLVHLKVCPHGEPGAVIGVHRGRLLVRFTDPKLEGRFRLESLVPAQPVAENSGSISECLTVRVAHARERNGI